MSAAFEHFLNGKDSLSTLLSALPVHEAPEAFEHKVFEAIRAQRNADLPVFEPPASLEASFLQDAAQIDAAQALRRKAILDALAGGQASKDVLGSPLSEASETWLQAQAVGKDASAPVKKPAKKLKAFWRDLGLVAAAAVVAVMATSLYLHLGTPAATTNLAEAAPQAAAPAPLPDKSADSAPAEKQEAEEAPAAKSAVVAAAFPQEQEKHDKAVTPKERSITAPQLARQEDAPVLNARAAHPASPNHAESRPTAQMAEAEAPASPLAIAAKPSLMMAPAPRAADNGVENTAKAGASPPPAAAPTAEKADIASSMSKAKRSKSLSAQHESAGIAQSCMVVALKYDPRLIAQHLEMTHCGQITALKTAIPDAPEALEWAERFRLALPENKRPAMLPLEKDSQVPFNLISIEALPAEAN